MRCFKFELERKNTLTLCVNKGVCPIQVLVDGWSYSFPEVPGNAVRFNFVFLFLVFSFSCQIYCSFIQPSLCHLLLIFVRFRSYPQNVDSQTSADSFTAPDPSINKVVVDPAGIF